MTASARGKCLARLGDLLAANSEALGRVETRDTGKMFKETAWQAKYIAEYFHFFAGAADKISGETLPIDKPDMFVFTDREPLGVVAAVIPWNSQMFLSAVKIAPALAAGNTIVLKASEEASTPCSPSESWSLKPVFPTALSISSPATVSPAAAP